MKGLGDAPQSPWTWKGLQQFLNLLAEAVGLVNGFFFPHSLGALNCCGVFLFVLLCPRCSGPSAISLPTAGWSRFPMDTTSVFSTRGPSTCSSCSALRSSGQVVLYVGIDSISLWEEVSSRSSYDAILPCPLFKFVILEALIREGNGTPLQYSCLENPMDGGAW